MVTIATTANIIRKNGKVAFTIYPISSPEIAWMTKSENPTGGVTWESSTIKTKNIPNQRGENPAAIIMGKTIGKVITTMDIPSSIMPKIIYIMPTTIIK